PADAVDYFLLGDECAHRKDLPQAVALTQKALPHSETTTTLKGADLPQAVAHFQKVLRLQPENFWAHYYLAVCSLQLQPPDQAEMSLTICQGRRPDFVWVYILRGYASGQLGERALRSQGANPEQRADQAARHFAAAAADFRQAEDLLERSPDQDGAYTL